MGIEQGSYSPEKKEKPDINEFIDDIVEKSGGNPGASRVLVDILMQKGEEVYRAVSPSLGVGAEIWDEYKDCGENIDKLVEKHSN